MADVPVLLVHGFASSFQRNWREPGWVDLLEEEGRQVIGVDLLGHGEADKPTDPQAYAFLERSVTDQMPPSGQVDAIGFSLGAQLLLRVASGAPERFRRLVVAGVGENVFAASDSDAVARAIESGERDLSGHEAAGAFVRFAAGSDNDPAALAACMRRPSTPLTESELARITVPVLVVLGDRDFVGSADRLMKALPSAQLASLSGADHFGTPKDFRFVDAALEFLRN
jgi:pimeloyl-ACP methyl ester carboxylesterase